MDNLIINVCEVYAENEAKAIEARKRWLCRSFVLDTMYENIPGLESAQLETKNFICDQLNAVVSKMLGLD